MNPVAILLADDHVVLREGLVRLLQPRFDIVGEVGDGHTLVKEAVRLRPDIIVIDIGMPLLNGIEAASKLRSILPETKLLLLTQHSGKEYVQAAFRLGVAGYVLKNTAAAELITAIDEVLAGRKYLSSELLQRFGDPDVLGENSGTLFGSNLTPRQREMLQLVAEGKSAKEIAHHLNISVKTVEFHKAAIMDELGLRTTAELTRYALAQRIVAG